MSVELKGYPVIMYSVFAIPTDAPRPVLLPLAGSSVRTGFPSPAEDWAEDALDLSKLLIKHEATTFLMRARGISMRDAGIGDGDLLVVDRYMRVQHLDIVVAEIDNEFTCKYISKQGNQVKLLAANPAFPEIHFNDGQTVVIWGVVTSCIKRFRKW